MEGRWDGYLRAWVCELVGKAYGHFLDAGIGYRFQLLVSQVMLEGFEVMISAMILMLKLQCIVFVVMFDLDFHDLQRHFRYSMINKPGQ